MFLKFQHLDATNCLHTLSSTKITANSISIGVSLTPIEKHNEHKFQGQKQTQKQQQVLLDTSFNMGKKLHGKNGFIRRNPDRKSGKERNFGVEQLNSHQNFAAQDGKGFGFRYKNGFMKRPDVKVDKNENFTVKQLDAPQISAIHGGKSDAFRFQNGCVKNPDHKLEKNQNFQVKLRPGNGHAAVVEQLHTQGSAKLNGKSGALKTQKGQIKNPDRKLKNTREIGGEVRSVNVNGAVVEGVKTKSLMKWLKYGGCIPAILEALESVPDLDEAFKPWKKSLTNKERSIILKEQVGWERALEIFEWFKRKRCYEVNVIHYNIMLRILGKARRWDEVEKLWNEMGEKRIEPINSTFGTLIDVYSKGGLTEDAIKWLELMNTQGMDPDEVTTGIVVQMYKKMGEFKKAEEFFTKWSLGKCLAEEQGNCRLGSTRGINGDARSTVCLSSFTYNTLIDMYGKAGQVKQAYETFEQMLRKGIVPTTVTFNTMIHICGNNGQLDEVSSLMRKMKDVLCPPDTRTYNILIFIHAKHDDIDTAARFFKEMKAASLEPDVVSYRTLLYAFSLRHMVGEAEELILEMDERGLEVDEFTQSALTRMYIEASMLESSWLWFQRFHLKGNMTSECYSANIDAFGEHGHVPEAEKVFNCCREVNKLSVLEFNVMIKAYGISKKCDAACSLFDIMEQYGVVPDRCSYNSLIQMLTSADMPQKARNYVRKMQEAGMVDDCIPYCAVISSFAKLGNLQMAVELYEEMIGFGIQPDVVVYGVLINAFTDCGSANEAGSLLDAMRSTGIPINAVICNSLIKLYTKVGYLEEAQQAYQMLQSCAVGPDVYSSNCMIDLYSKLSMVRHAEEVFEKLKRKEEANEFSYAMMLCMYKRNGMFMEAIQIAQKMMELGLLTDLLSYNNVLSLYASDGRYKEASETFKEMLESAIQPDDSTFKALGIILLKCGVPREAVGKLERLRKDDSLGGLQAWTSTLSSVMRLSDSPDDDDDVSSNI